LGQPHRIRDIRFPTRQVFHIPGIHQHHRQVVFEQVEERLPIIPRGFHHDHRHVLGQQELPQSQHLFRRRAPRRHSGIKRSRPRPRNPHTYLRIAFGDIDPHRPLIHHIHCATSDQFDERRRGLHPKQTSSLYSQESCRRVRTAETKSSWTTVQDTHCPRHREFPLETSTVDDAPNAVRDTFDVV